MAQAAATDSVAQPGKLPRAFPVILTAQLITSIGFAFSTPFLPLFIAEIGGLDARSASFWTGIVSFCSGVVMLFAGPLWGTLADWFGYKKNALRAAFCACLIVAGTGACQNILQVAIVRALMGGFTGVVPANMGLIAAVVPRPRLAFAVGISQGMSSLGFTLGPLLGGLAVGFLGYRWGFAFSGALIGVAGLLVLLGVRAPAQVRSNSPKSIGQFFKDVKILLAAPGMKGAMLLVGMVQLIPNVVAPVTVFYLKSLGANVGPGTIGVYYTVAGLSTTGAAWGIGFLSTRFPLQRLMLLAAAIAMAGAAGMSFAPSIPMAMLMGAVTGLGAGMLTAGGAAWAGSVAPQGQTGAAFGVVQSANALGFGVGPVIGGILASAISLRAPFAGQAALALVLAVVILRLRRKI